MADQETADSFLRRCAAEVAVPILKQIEELLLTHLVSLPETNFSHLIEQSRSFRREIIVTRRREIAQKMLEAQEDAILQILENDDAPEIWKVEFAEMLLEKEGDSGLQVADGDDEVQTQREEFVEAELRILLWQWEVEVDRTLERTVSQMLGLPLAPLAWGPDDIGKEHKPSDAGAFED